MSDSTEHRPGWMVEMNPSPPVMGTIPTDALVEVRDHAGRLRDSDDRTGNWSHDVVWALAAEVVMHRIIDEARVDAVNRDQRGNA